MLTKKLGLLLTLLILLYLSFSALAFAAMNGTSPEELYKAFGVQKFNQPVKAPGFSISDLKGQEFALQNFQGKVVLLTFFTID